MEQTTKSQKKCANTNHKAHSNNAKEKNRFFLKLQRTHSETLHCNMVVDEGSLW